MKTFNQIASDIFALSESEIRDSLSPKDIPEWDSMNYLLFISEIEKEFDISFTMDEVLNAKSIGDIRKVIEEKKSS